MMISYQSAPRAKGAGASVLPLRFAKRELRPDRSLGKHRRQDIAGYRPADDISLNIRTVSLPKEFDLRVGFDPLGHHRDFEILGHGQYGGNDGGVFRIHGDMTNETGINLELIDRQLPEVT